MASTLVTLAEASDVRSRIGRGGPVLLPPSAVPLNLLLEWPERSGRQWTGIFAASITLHFVLFLIAVQIPSIVGSHEPAQTVVVHRIPLYLPPDVMTQRAPNRRKLSRKIDLADLLATQESQAQRAAPRPSAKRFELPKQSPPSRTIKSPPQILPEAPAVALNQAPGSPPLGSPAGITAPPPPAPSTSPFEDVGTQVAPSAHPQLAPPKSSVQAAINGLTQNAQGRHLVISDDAPSEPSPGAPGSIARPEGQHSAVELQSDPQGADFKPYLRQILAIVRGNWRRVIPESARMGTLRGRTVLEFIISRDGSIPKLVTADSSGSEPLDRAAVAGLSMSNPLPPLPADFKGFQVRLAFSFAYNMPAE
ncbi:MAG TPA: TonB family protein [Bryobacteraceae bacterium]|jgi:TonB family protein